MAKQGQAPNRQEFFIERPEIRGRLIIPATYFIKRGFNAAVLDKYDVGFPIRNDGEFRERVIVPVYDESGKFFVGCVGRSIHNMCGHCQCYHNPNFQCPAENIRFAYSKWKANSGFDKRINLYNFWEAKKSIKKTGTIILTESPGSVWKIVEAGFEQAVACFGTSLSDEQRIIIERSGALRVIIAMDGDKAGREASLQLAQQLNRGFNVKVLNLPEDKDFGDLTAVQAKELIGELNE